MSRTVIRVTPVGGFDIPELERWLAAMSKKGLRFSMTAGLLTVFERAERRTVQIHLEPIRGAVEDDPELNALYDDAGWKYWGIFRGSFYVFASDDLTARAHTDVETHEYALKRFFRGKVIGGGAACLGKRTFAGSLSKGCSVEDRLDMAQIFSGGDLFEQAGAAISAGGVGTAADRPVVFAWTLPPAAIPKGHQKWDGTQ